MNYVDNSTKLSTACGTFLTIFVNINSEDIIKTIVLAIIGGSSSFMATLLLKILIQKIKRNRKE